VEPFAVKDCALIAIATGERARDLRELRYRLRDTHPGSIYHHFWGVLLRPAFDDPEFPNDFASWAWYGLHDRALAERLALLDPKDFDDLEGLRRAVLDVVEERLWEREGLLWAPADRHFHFTRSATVVFDTRSRVDDPRSLAEAVHAMSLGSVFYHLVDARRRTPSGRDDLTEWLAGLDGDFQGAVDHLALVDPYFTTLAELREQVAGILREWLP
jgi:hypothetical protein